MFRVFLAFGTFALLGIFGTYWTLAVPTNTRPTDGQKAPGIYRAFPVTGFGSVDERLQAFRSVSDLRTTEALEDQIERLSLESRSVANDARIEALMLRLLEQDPQRAVDLVVSLPVGPAMLTFLFSAWASVDIDSALLSLARIENSNWRRQIAIDLTRGLNISPNEIAGLAAIVDESGVDGFYADAQVGIVGHDPIGAMGQALRIDDVAIQHRTIRRIAGEWTRQSPDVAKDYLSTVAEVALRHEFFYGMAAQWVTVDPEEAISYLTTGEGRQFLSALPSQLTSSLLSRWVVASPEFAMRVRESLPPALRQQVTRLVMAHLADTNLTQAMERFGSLPIEEEDRPFLKSAIAVSYAKRDPAGAMAWARNVDRMTPPSRFEVSAVVVTLTSIASTDLETALDLALNEPDFSGSIGGLLSAAGVFPPLDSIEARRIAGKLASIGSLGGDSLSRFVGAWARHDPDGMLTWVSEQDLRSNPDLIRSASGGLAEAGQEIPPSFADELPSELRGELVRSYVGSLMRVEPDTAMSWLNNFRGDPEYDDWAGQIAGDLAVPAARGSPRNQQYPLPAAKIISTMFEPPRPEVSVGVSVAWAQQDPKEAIDWAFGLSNSDAREVSVAATAGVWTIRDPDAARAWTLALPAGDLRDHALAAILTQEIATHGSIDPRVLNAFESDSAVNDAMGRAAFASALAALSTREPEKAVDLMDTYFDDPEFRQRVLDEAQVYRDSSMVFPRDAVVSVLAR